MGPFTIGIHKSLGRKGFAKPSIPLIREAIATRLFEKEKREKERKKRNRHKERNEKTKKEVTTERKKERKKGKKERWKKKGKKNNFYGLFSSVKNFNLPFLSVTTWPTFRFYFTLRNN